MWQNHTRTRFCILCWENNFLFRVCRDLEAVIFLIVRHNPSNLSKCRGHVNKHIFILFKKPVTFNNWFCLGFTSDQHCKGYMAALQLYLWKKTSSAPPCIFQTWAGTWAEPPNNPLAGFGERQVILKQRL